MNVDALISTLSLRTRSVPIVILYVTAACNLRCITCSYRRALPNELRVDEYEALSKELTQLGLRRVVYSGGEPLVRKDLPDICGIFQKSRVKQSLLTNGVFLERRIGELGAYLDEVIVSLDGPDAQTHNGIRGSECFDQIVKGMEKVVSRAPGTALSIRMVVQRRNFRMLDSMVTFAKIIGAARVSFLAADVLSNAFHRNHTGPAAPENDILLTRDETAEFRELVGRMVTVRREEIESGFVSESPSRLMQLVEYFEAFHGGPFPPTTCNAPNISTVITSTGELLPCYFLPAYGDVRSGGLRKQMNNDLIRFTRKQVRNLTLKQCRTCVCTLRISPQAALFDRF